MGSFRQVDICWGDETKTLTPTLGFLDELEASTYSAAMIIDSMQSKNPRRGAMAMFIARVLAEAGFDVDGGDVNAEISHDLETGVSYFLYLLKQIMPEEPKGKKMQAALKAVDGNST